MYVVYKYPLSIEKLQIVTIPGLLQLLAIKTQQDAPCLWALVNLESKFPVEIEVQTVWTGEPVLTVRQYFGTCLILGDGFVAHYFVDAVTGDIHNYL